MKTKILAVCSLPLLLLSSCFEAKNAKQLYKVDEEAWHILFQKGKALDPYGNVSISVINAGKVCFGTSADPEIQIFMSNGNIYIDGYKDVFYQIPADAYDTKTDTYKGVKCYQAQSEDSWISIGTTDMESLSFVAYYVTPALQIKNLEYNDFKFDNQYNIYKCDSVKSKGYWLPNDPEFTLTDVALHIREGNLQTLEYFIEEYNTKITISYYDYGNTSVKTIEELMKA